MVNYYKLTSNIMILENLLWSVKKESKSNRIELKMYEIIQNHLILLSIIY
jgi:hypothetical protein